MYNIPHKTKCKPSEALINDCKPTWQTIEVHSEHSINGQSYCPPENVIFSRGTDEITRSGVKSWQVVHNGFCSRSESVSGPRSRRHVYTQELLPSSWANWMRPNKSERSRCHLRDNENMMPYNKFPDQRELLELNNLIPSAGKVFDEPMHTARFPVAH